MESNEEWKSSSGQMDEASFERMIEELREVRRLDIAASMDEAVAAGAKIHMTDHMRRMIRIEAKELLKRTIDSLVSWRRALAASRIGKRKEPKHAT